jgi:hypothetical protein
MLILKSMAIGEKSVAKKKGLVVGPKIRNSDTKRGPLG